VGEEGEAGERKGRKKDKGAGRMEKRAKRRGATRGFPRRPEL